MKKLILCLLVLALSLTGCANSSDDSNETTNADDNLSVSYDSEVSADVVIVGAGAAGLSSAIAAVENGAEKVIILEKTNITGGSLNYTTGTIAGAETKIQELDGVEDSIELFVEDMYNIGREKGNLELLTVFAEKNTEVVDWLWDIGLYDNAYTGDSTTGTISVYAPEHELYSQKRSYKFTADDTSTYSSAVHEILDELVKSNDAIEIVYATEAVELLANDQNQVLSVAAEQGNQLIKYTAEMGVILATGGYSGNTELMGAFTENGDSYLVGGSDAADGYGIYMAQEVGAYIDEEAMSYVPTFPMGYQPESGPGLIRPTYTYKTGGIAVNANGERFVDETTEDLAARESALEEQPDAIQYDIFTEDIIADLIANNAAIFYTYFYAPGMALESQVVSASSIEELADLIGVPADNLVATVESYNNNVENQTTDEFGREFSEDSISSYNLAINKIEGDTYYAVPIQALCVMTLGGVSINEYGQVLDNNNNAIPGLYAAGEMVGGIWGRYVSSGTGVMGPVTFGQIAGENVMSQDLATDYELVASSNVIAKELVVKAVVETEARFDMSVTLTDGTYTATVSGQEGDMVVEVTVTDGVINEVILVESNETETIAKTALEQIPLDIVAQNSPDVDTVSGATLTSNRIMDAVAICLEEAAE
ncbi:MAG: FAD-dependent oxidoreductase [Erysipelotrichaceae bacterium]